MQHLLFRGGKRVGADSAVGQQLEIPLGLRDLHMRREGTAMRRSSRVKRQSPTSISIDPNVRCEKVYPAEGTVKKLSDLKTIGVKLTRDQALHLARVLLAVTQDWKEIDITAFRLERRKSDGTHHITVTSANKEPTGKMEVVEL